MKQSLLLMLALAASAAEPVSPESRALAFLAREVPAWKVENRCYSCHNNGDGARVLYIASRKGWSVPAPSLEDTSRWLAAPSGWENNRGDQNISDKKLARLQFAAALSEAVESGVIKDRQPLLQAASLVAADQHSDGSWQVDSETSAGSPITYGTALATAMARSVLVRAGAERFRSAIHAAGDWLRKLRVNYVPEAAAILVGLHDDAGRQPEMIAFLRQAQAGNGGWGPARNTPAEPFDTALALLALQTLPSKHNLKAMIGLGRSWLVATQLPSGGWPETTRPAGGQSYAQSISTAAWATLALLDTAGDQNRRR